MTDTMTSDDIRDLVKGEHVCIFSSLENDRIRSHPMSPQFAAGEPTIWFLVEKGAHKLADLKADCAVTLAFNGGAAGWYVSLMGRASLVEDRQRVAALWSAPLKQYFDGPDDPRIVLVAFAADEADYWDGPNALVAGIKMLVTAATGSKTDMGSSGRVGM